jgi:hypothetical protein
MHRIAGMNRSLLTTLAATLLLSGVPVTSPVHATSAVLRCQSPDGTLVYTDKACGALGAKSMPLPGELLARIYNEEARFGGKNADAAIAPMAGAPPERRSASSGCARSPTQLAMDLRGSLALGDVNRVAESYHWVGMSSRQGERTLDRLQHLVGQAVLDSHYFDARIASASSPGTLDAGASVLASSASALGGNAGMLQLVLGDHDAARSVVDFNVHRYAGCYFVAFQ